MKDVGFKLADLVKPYNHQYDLVVGNYYSFYGEKVKLERITVTPSFEVRKSWLGRFSYKPKYRVDVVYSVVHGPNSLIKSEVSGKPLEFFIEGLDKADTFGALLKQCWEQLFGDKRNV